MQPLTTALTYFNRGATNYIKPLQTLLEEKGVELAVYGTATSIQGGLCKTKHGDYFTNDTPNVLATYIEKEKVRLEERISLIQAKLEEDEDPRFRKTLEIGLEDLTGILEGIDRLQKTPHEKVENVLMFTYETGEGRDELVQELIKEFLASGVLEEEANATRLQLVYTSAVEFNIGKTTV